MQTNLSPDIRQTPSGQAAEKIIRSCVHCGFCNATCPTYQLLGDELDGPRGRIYLMKQMFEGHAVTAETQKHLDRCLTCRACETTCPSGVQYGKLLDIARHRVEKMVPRPCRVRFMRTLLTSILPYPYKYRWAIKAASFFRPLLPRKLKSQLPRLSAKPEMGVVGRTHKQRQRAVLLVQGCAQSVLGEEINLATEKVLSRLGIGVEISAGEGCCGAINHHLGQEAGGHAFIRQNIEAWWAYINTQKVEAIISTASGCGVHLKDYGHLLPEGDPYKEKAVIISQHVKDIGEFLSEEDLSEWSLSDAQTKKVAFHSPCTLQHGQKKGGVVEKILAQCGYTLSPVPDAHLCCGSAGTYSILQPKMSKQLACNKVSALQSDRPDIIATANIGCLLQLRQGADRPVRHWIELLAKTN